MGITFTEDARCALTDPETFFTDAPMRAKAICGACPARLDCLQYALHNDVWGVWGGTTRAERAALREELDIVPESLSTAAFAGVLDD